MSPKSLFALALLALSFQPFSTRALAVSHAGGDLEAETATTAGNLKTGFEKNETAAENQTEYKYITQQDVTLQGLVLRGEAEEKDLLQVLPTEILIPAGTPFYMEDRTDDGEGNRFVKIGIETGDESNSILRYWLNEGDFVRSLYKVRADLSEEQFADLNLDNVDGRDARFNYGSSYAVAGPNQFMMPVMGARRSSPPGMRIHPITKKRKLHAGWDLAAPSGTPVMAAADGVVESAGWGGGYGNLIILRHGKLRTRYGHLSKILVKSGQSVRRGFVIGKVGSTGLSTGPHLHFEQRSATGAVIYDRPNEAMLAEFKKGGSAAVTEVKPSAPVTTVQTAEVKKTAVTVKKAAPALVKKAVVKAKAKPVVKKKRKIRKVVKPQDSGWPQPIQW